MNEPLQLIHLAEKMVKNAGIDNYSVDQDTLVMCGTRYRVEPCTCGEHDCNGVQLRTADSATFGITVQ